MTTCTSSLQSSETGGVTKQTSPEVASVTENEPTQESVIPPWEEAPVTPSQVQQ